MFLLVLLIALPAAVNPQGVLAVEPFKTTILRVGAVLLAVSWLSFRVAGASSVDVGAHPVVRAALVIAGVATMSTILSIEPQLSFFGSFDRGMGWLSLAAFAVVLLASADLLTDPVRRERAVNALLIGAVIPCAYMLVQVVGLDPIHWAARAQPGSSFGSPTFLGGYLVLVFPFAAYRVLGQARAALHGKLPAAYTGWLALLLVICAVTLLTGIRAALLGLVAATATFAAFSAGGQRVARRAVGAALGLLLLTSALATVTGGAYGLRGFERFLTIGGPIDSSSERLIVWRDSIGAPLADPLRALLGYGDETQSVVFEHLEATVRQTQVELWDRAHNLLLDTWLTGGLLGVAALLALLGSAAWSAWQARGGDRLLAAAVMAALVGHLVEVSFAFHSVATGAVFWFVLGLAASLAPRPLDSRPAIPPAAARVGVLAGLLVVPLLVTPAIADWLYGNARRANFEIGAALEEQAAAIAPWVEELPRAAGLDWLQVANRRSDRNGQNRAEADLLEAARRAQLAPLPQLRLARLYLARGDLDRAEAACQRALTAGPYRASVWEACADVSSAAGQPELASERRARADSLR